MAPFYSRSIMGKYYYIPERMGGGIKRYIEKGIIPGSFLHAVICNDLKQAFGLADDENFHNIAAYISYFYNDTPASCHGSKKAMEAWHKKGGLNKNA